MRPVQDIDVLTEPQPTTRQSLRFAIVSAAIVLALDQITKRWALRDLGEGPCGADPDNCIDVFWTLRFNLVENPGAAFSTGTSLGPLFAVIAAVMTVVLFNVARKRTDRLGPVLLGLIGGGALGNLVDRLVRAEDGIGTGSVVDFVDFQWWPVFNVADVGVVMGVILFVLYSMFEPEHPPFELDHDQSALDEAEPDPTDPATDDEPTYDAESVGTDPDFDD